LFKKIIQKRNAFSYLNKENLVNADYKLLKKMIVKSLDYFNT